MTPVVYSSESSLREPRAFVRAMFSDLAAARELAQVLFLRNVRAQFRQSLLGYAWLFLPPLVTTATWVFLNMAGILNTQTTTVPYPLYVLTGTLLWQGFTDALNCPLTQLNASKSMLNKVNFPREALILAGIAEVILNFVVRLMVVGVVFLALRFPIPPTILLAPFGMLALLAFGLMLGLLSVPFGMLYQDVQRGLGIIVTLWFFVTPIVYATPSSAPLATILWLNPVTPLLVTTRDWLTTGSTNHLAAFLVITLLTVPGIFFAWSLLRLAMPHLIARTLTR